MVHILEIYCKVCIHGLVVPAKKTNNPRVCDPGISRS